MRDWTVYVDTITNITFTYVYVWGEAKVFNHTGVTCSTHNTFRSHWAVRKRNMVLHLRALWVLGMMSVIWMIVEASTTDDNFINPCKKYFYKWVNFKVSGLGKTEFPYLFSQILGVRNYTEYWRSQRCVYLSCNFFFAFSTALQCCAVCKDYK